MANLSCAARYSAASLLCRSFLNDDTFRSTQRVLDGLVEDELSADQAGRHEDPWSKSDKEACWPGFLCKPNELGRRASWPSFALVDLREERVAWLGDDGRSRSLEGAS